MSTGIVLCGYTRESECKRREFSHMGGFMIYEKKSDVKKVSILNK
jgi:hypothetical protein